MKAPSSRFATVGQSSGLRKPRVRTALAAVALLLGLAQPAVAQLSIGVGLPGLSIGINVPLFPNLVRVPGYPVYYAPGQASNYFFYDGMYWVYQGDNWYASTWYNGPWGEVSPSDVPLFVLRVPVRYYRNPPVYFRGWQRDAPPRWGEHWGPSWQQQRNGWDRWNRYAAPRPAPLPIYQRQYPAGRYPQPEQQQDLRRRNYRYEPQDRSHVAPEAPRGRASPEPQRGPCEAPRGRDDRGRSDTGSDRENEKSNGRGNDRKN